LMKHFDPAPGYGIETTTHYIGNIVYEGGKVSYITTDEGRLIPFGTGTNRVFVFEYNLRDHLGNNRVTFMGTNLGGAVDIVQTTSYYPFGLVMNQVNGNTDPTYQKNKYLYNGKEHQDVDLAGSSLNWFDYGARMYDPQIGRWHIVDPAAELGRRWSPYTYTFDNPMRFIDPDGMWPGDPFKTQRLAAIDFGRIFNGKSIEGGKEYGASVYTTKINGKTYYTYSVPNSGTAYGVEPSLPPFGSKTTAIVHTHAKYEKYGDNDNFSRGEGEDIDYFKSRKVDGYVATPSGVLKEYDVETGKETIVSKEMPSDPNHPNRENNINPSGIDLSNTEAKAAKKLDQYLEILKPTIKDDEK
ncbi:MAG: DUF4329 domain-containing protein, partial [Bacteroidota bacterium]